MKKLFLLPVLFCSLFLSAQQGKFKAGANLGLPVGKSSDWSNLTIGLQATYYFWYPMDELKVGATIGYQHFFSKNIEYFNPFTGKKEKYNVEDYGYIPLAATVQYNFDDMFFAGADLGIGVSTESGVDTGLFFKPMIGADFDKWDVALYYNIGERGFSNIGLGVNYKFF